MLRRLQFCLLLPGMAQACTDAGIDEAVGLVLQANPVLQAEQREYRETTRQRAWSLKLDLDYPLIEPVSTGTDTTTTSEGSGPRAALALSIPLFDRSHDLERSKAQAALQRNRDTLMKSFLDELHKLCTQRDKVHEQQTLHRFYRDRLRYRKEQVKAGIDEPDVLWQEAERGQKTAQQLRRERGELKAQQLSVARRFGGTEWKRLQALLAGISK